MSVHVMAMVWESTVPAPERFTLLALADRADEDGRCWPSIPTLAKKCRTGESTIRRHLASLRTLGAISIEQRWNNSSVYTISLPKLRELTDVEPPSQLDTPHQIDRGFQIGTPPEIDTPTDLAPPPNLSATPSQSERLSVIDPSTQPSRPGPTPSKRKTTAAEPPRAEVIALCKHLCERVVANGSIEPTPSAKQGWLTDARRMLDLDKRPVAEAHALIDWCQSDSFWRGNIESMGKFRKKYDQLRLKALAESGTRHLTSVPVGPPAARFDAIREAADAQQAATLINELWREPAKPPTDRTPIDQWMRARKVEWIDAHADAIRAALTSKDTG